MTLAMGWDEWAAHDAVALAARVRQGDVTAAELAAQVAAGVAQVNPQLNAVVETTLHFIRQHQPASLS